MTYINNLKYKQMAKKTIEAKNAVKRKEGKLYFVDSKGNVVSTPMNRKGAKKGHKTCK